MHPSISLTPRERNVLLDYYRAPFYDPALRLRAHILLLLADGHLWAVIAAVLFCSTRTIDRWHKRFRHGRLDALLGRPRGRRPHLGQRWADLVVFWVTQLVPRAFGYLRSRWSCGLLALVLWRRFHVRVCRETVRRWLGGADVVWRRPRPVLGRRDPDREAILDGLRALLRDLPDDETAMFKDEADINLNPEIGFMWMRSGQQAEVATAVPAAAALQGDPRPLGRRQDPPVCGGAGGAQGASGPAGAAPAAEVRAIGVGPWGS